MDYAAASPLLGSIVSGTEAEAIALVPASDLSVEGPDGLCAVHLATRLELYGLMEELIGRGEASRRTAHGETALMFAVARGKLAAIASLLARGGANDADVDGSTALMKAARHGDESVVDLLLPHSNPSLRNARGFDAEDSARLFGLPAIAEKIRSYRLSLEERALFEELGPRAAPSTKRPAL